MENEKIIIPFSELEIQELAEGEEFHWTFTTNKGRTIDVLIRQETDDEAVDETTKD